MRRIPIRTARAARRRALLRRALPLAAALGLGLLAGRAMSPGGGGNVVRPVKAATAPSTAAIPAEFPHTRAGAAAAAAAYERSFAAPRILRPGQLRARIEAVAMPEYVAQMLAANSPGAEGIAAGPIGEGLAEGLSTLYMAVPIGYRVQSYTPRRARILTWGFTLLGNGASVEPAAYFGLTHTELRWASDGWRIAESRAGFGPTPKLATPPGPLGAYRVIDLASRLRSYRLAP